MKEIVVIHGEKLRNFTLSPSFEMLDRTGNTALLQKMNSLTVSGEAVSSDGVLLTRQTEFGTLIIGVDFGKVRDTKTGLYRQRTKEEAFKGEELLVDGKYSIEDYRRLQNKRAPFAMQTQIVVHQLSEDLHMQYREQRVRDPYISLDLRLQQGMCESVIELVPTIVHKPIGRNRQ